MTYVTSLNSLLGKIVKFDDVLWQIQSYNFLSDAVTATQIEPILPLGHVRKMQFTLEFIADRGLIWDYGFDTVLKTL